MDNYYIYRVNVQYDGFYPENIRERSQGGKFIFNWRAYIDNLDIGDVVLVYFLGSGVRDGIYAITKVEEINARLYESNVIADILYSSNNNWHPIVSKKEYKSLFRGIMYRPRGAEIVISASNETQIINIIKESRELTHELTKIGVSLPGLSAPLILDFNKIPLVDPKRDYSPKLKRLNIVSAFWIRPKQATWLKFIGWLSNISTLFYKYKSGDLSHIKEFGRALGGIIKTYIGEHRLAVDFMISVPLSEEKRRQGEIDRVSFLCECLSDYLGIPYLNVLTLEGNISRVRYKRLGLSNRKFIRDYTANLRISRKGLKAVNDSKGKILIVDDVFTDGVTTETIKKFVFRQFPHNKIEIHKGTLGVMAKVNNISSKLRERWHN